MHCERSTPMTRRADPDAIGLPLPVRLHPGDDLCLALQAVAAAQGCRAAFVLAGIGSLRGALLRLAGAGQPLAVGNCSASAAALLPMARTCT